MTTDIGAGPTSHPTAEGALLEARDLVRHYSQRGRGRGVVHAVDGITLGVGARETLGVVGESGCGKSTLARVLVGIEPPTSGAVWFEGTDVATLSRAGRRRLRRDVQIVLQDPYTSLDPRMTAEQILAEPFEIHADARRGIDLGARIRELLEMVGLNPDHARRYPHQFSGGQRQRIGIARALALRPRVVVCDEPVSALDVSIQAQVVNLLSGLQEQFGLSYVFIAHDLSVIRQVADRLAVMYLGKVVESGPADGVFGDPRHPYTRALLSAAPIPDPTLRGTRTRTLLVGDLPSPTDPPSGCRFRTRCPIVAPVCAEQEPRLLAVGEDHVAACHFSDRPREETRV